MKVTLNDGFKDLKTGNGQLLVIKAVSYDEKKCRMRVTFGDAEGGSSSEFYNLYTKKRVKGKKGLQTVPNEGALTAFSTMAKHALGDWNRTDIDPEELVGCYVLANVNYDDVKVKDDNGEETGEVKQYLHIRNFKETDRTFDDDDEVNDDDVEEDDDEDLDDDDEDDDDDAFK